MIVRGCAFPAVWAVLALACGSASAGTVEQWFQASGAGDVARAGKLLQENPHLLDATDGAGRTALHIAIENRRANSVRFLLGKGAKCRVKDRRGRTAMRLASRIGSEDLAMHFLLSIPDIDLWEAAENGDADAVALVARGDPDRVNIRSPLGYGRSPLDKAVANREVEVVRILLGAGTELRRWAGARTALHDAAEKGYLEVVQAFVDAKVDVNLLNDTYGTPLHLAAAFGRADVIDLLLRSGAKVNLTSEGWSALHAAAWYGHPAAAEKLIAAGAKIDPVTKWGWRPIHGALWQGHDKIVRLLLDRGTKMDACTAAAMGRVKQMRKLLEKPLPKELKRSIGSHPAFWAVRCGQLEALKELGKDPATLAIRNCRSYCLLHAAAEAGRVEIIHWLIKQGADVNAPTANMDWFDKATPLHVAAAAGKVPAAKALLAAGARIEGTADKSTATKAYTKSGYTPLLAAVTEGQEEMVAFLLDSGADIEAKATKDVTALSEAADEGHIEICKLLLLRDAKVGGETATRTPLHSAADEGHIEIMRLLFAHKADVNAGAEQGWTPLSEAAGCRKANKAEPVKWLLEHGARVIDGKGERGESPLRAALDQQNAEAAMLLLDAGARVSARDNDPVCIHAGRLGRVDIMKRLLAVGAKLKSSRQSKYDTNGLRTALQGAAATGRKDMVRFLLAQKGDPNEKNSGDHSLLHLAARSGCKLVAAVLLDAGAAPGGGRRGSPLTVATENGHVGLVRFFLAKGVSTKEAAVCAAAGAGRKKILAALLPADLKQDSSAAKVLHTAIGKKQADIVRMLLKRGADVNAPDDKGRTPLYAAINHYDIQKDIVELLLEAGADPNIANKDKLTPLHEAISKDRYDLARLLQVKGARTDVFTAAALGQWKRVSALVAADSDVVHNRRGTIGLPLHWAAHGGHAEVVTFLLAHKADVHGRSKVAGRIRRTPLYWAARNGHVEALRLLLQKTDEVEPPTPVESERALHAAVRYARTEVVKALLSRKVDPNAGAMHSKWRPLHTAANVGVPEIIRLLLAHGAQVSPPNDRGRTPLDIALNDTVYMDHAARSTMKPRRREKVAEILLDHKAKVTPGASLHWAAKKGYLGVVERLLAAGADVNARDRYETTALHAAINGLTTAYRSTPSSATFDVKNSPHMKIIKLLLAKGADARAKTKRGHGVMWYAVDCGLKELIELVREHQR